MCTVYQGIFVFEVYVVICDRGSECQKILEP
jgi:hypothetical protein